VVTAGSRNPTSPETQSYTRTYSRSGQVRDDTRALATRNTQLNNQIYPGLHIRQADARWRISGVDINFINASRVASR
jgi:hypothetical protein